MGTPFGPSWWAEITADLEFYLGPWDTWASTPRRETPRLFRENGWDVLDSEIIEETVKKVKARALKPLPGWTEERRALEVLGR